MEADFKTLHDSIMLIFCCRTSSRLSNYNIIVSNSILVTTTRIGRGGSAGAGGGGGTLLAPLCTVVGLGLKNTSSI